MLSKPQKWIIFLVVTIILVVVVNFILRKYKEAELDKQYNQKEKAFFTQIYADSLWGSSGIGSIPENSLPYLKLLQSMFDDPKFKTIVDLGCGDWQLMSTINIPERVTYKGYDLVDIVINKNKELYSKKNVKFHHIGGLSDMKKQKGDLLIIKDVMQHWGGDQMNYFIKHILPNFKYALITNDFEKPAVNLSPERYKIHGKALDLQAPDSRVKDNVKVLLDYWIGDEMKRVYLYTNPK